MNIRYASEKDIEAITEIYNEAILKTTATFDTQIKTNEDQKKWLSRHSEKMPVWVCEDEGRVVGWASLSPWSDRCAYTGTVENSVYILEKHQGKGFGKALMETLMAFARENKFRTIIARVSDGNKASLLLHQRYGFETIGVMKKVGNKFGRLIDVHMMQVML